MGDQKLNDNKAFITDIGHLRLNDGRWWYCKYMDAINMAPALSGATQTTPDVDTLGGYQLNTNTEYLYFQGRVCSHWDEASDLMMVIVFETNADNSAGDPADTVDLSLLCYYKGDGDIVNKTQTIEVATTIGQAAQYKQFTALFTVDYTKVDNVVDLNDTFMFRLNLETDTSEVEDVIINFAVWRYKTAYPHAEV